MLAPDDRGQALSGLAKNLLTEKSIESALKRAAEEGKPITIQDTGGLTMIAKPHGFGCPAARLTDGMNELYRDSVRHCRAVDKVGLCQANWLDRSVSSTACEAGDLRWPKPAI